MHGHVALACSDAIPIHRRSPLDLDRCGGGLRRPGRLPEETWPFPIKTLVVGKDRVAYTDVGEGPVLLFSHVGMWSFIWRDVIVALAASHRCIAFDPLGSGLSDRVPADHVTLAAVRDTAAALIEELDLQAATLVMHDLGGMAALAAVADRPDRIVGLVAVNTFGWQPTGWPFRGMLATFGSRWMRWLDAVTGWLTWASTTVLGVGRHLDGPSRRAFRAGMDRQGRANMHRLFASAPNSPDVYEAAERVLSVDLAQRPLLTVFGALGDYLRFRPRWRARFPGLDEVVVPWGIHFPTCDDPARTATALAQWHEQRVGPGLPQIGRG